MTGDLVKIERPLDGLAIVTLNRPAVMNALSISLRRALVARLAELRDDDVHVIILTGQGRAFCAGLDLRELSEDSGALASIASSDPAAAVRAFDGIVIGAINGPAITGGFELALACDILIASETACFADTHARVGVLPGWQLSQRLSRTIGLYRAKLISLTGRPVTAHEAQSWGLVSEVLAPNALLDRARAIAADVLALSPENLQPLKRLIDDGYAVSLEDAVALEASRAAEHNGRVSASAMVDYGQRVIQQGRRSAKAGEGTKS